MKKILFILSLWLIAITCFAAPATYRGIFYGTGQQTNLIVTTHLYGSGNHTTGLTNFSYDDLPYLTGGTNVFIETLGSGIHITNRINLSLSTGSLTPWTSDINGASHSLTNVASIGIGTASTAFALMVNHATTPFIQFKLLNLAKAYIGVQNASDALINGGLTNDLGIRIEGSGNSGLLGLSTDSGSSGVRIAATNSTLVVKGGVTSETGFTGNGAGITNIATVIDSYFTNFLHASSGTYQNYCTNTLTTGKWVLSGSAGVQRSGSAFTSTDIEILFKSDGLTFNSPGKNSSAYEGVITTNFTSYTLIAPTFTVDVTTATTNFYLTIYCDAFTGNFPVLSGSFHAEKKQ